MAEGLHEGVLLVNDATMKAPPDENLEPEATTGETNNLQELISSGHIETLEAGVQVGLKLLDKIRAPLETVMSDKSSIAARWLKSIMRVQSSAEPTRVIVGVVGNTGAGKSSVINALLGGER